MHPEGTPVDINLGYLNFLTGKSRVNAEAGVSNYQVTVTGVFQTEASRESMLLGRAPE